MNVLFHLLLLSFCVFSCFRTLVYLRDPFGIRKTPTGSSAYTLFPTSSVRVGPSRRRPVHRQTRKKDPTERDEGIDGQVRTEDLP